MNERGDPVSGNLSRRDFIQAGVMASLGAVAATSGARTFAAGTDPGTAWQRHATPEAAGFSSQALARVEAALYTKPTTSLLVVKGGKIVYAYGDIAHVSYLASARKSILSILYGKYVANGRIRLDQTIGDIGIDEGGSGLTSLEKSATVRDLLMSSSGVYWPAGSPGGDEASTPARGSFKPGAHFLYNNWDFNVAGAIFERLTGQTVFHALEYDLARPLGFQDFDMTRQRMLGYKTNPSRYKAFHMFLSARDMARLGLVMVNGGLWNNTAVVPRAWVVDSTTLRVPVSRMDRPGSTGYGYLWWIPTESRSAPEWRSAFMANGNYGQYILGLPALELVIVHRRAVTDEFAIARNLGESNASPAGGGVSADDFLRIADQIVAARI
jgi:CubicO group peptidase (beta-lactamase class C family)